MSKKMSIGIMRMLRWINDNTITHEIRNECILKKLKASSIEDKMMKN